MRSLRVKGTNNGSKGYSSALYFTGPTTLQITQVHIAVLINIAVKIHR